MWDAGRMPCPEHLLALSPWIQTMRNPESGLRKEDAIESDGKNLTEKWHVWNRLGASYFATTHPKLKILVSLKFRSQSKQFWACTRV